jgi:hypothetical protein
MFAPPSDGSYAGDIATRTRSTSAALLDRRALNRATLARQFLLERARMPALAAIEHLVGMQAQAPHAPYVGLWARLRGFRAQELAELISSRQAVRAPLMRATLHLVSASDCLKLRPALQSVLERSFAGAPFDIDGVDRDGLIAAGRRLVEEHPRTRVELGAALASHWPESDAASLAHAITYLVALVQVPPRGLWGRSGAARWTTIESWLGREVATGCSRDELFLRYLAAFGPATVKDAQTWSGLTRLAEVADRLRPQLHTFRDEHGNELLDMPDAPRPDPDTPVSPRFLPEYDNVLLSHADRTRFISARNRVPLPPGAGARTGTVLIDGFLAATWTIAREHGRAILHITPIGRLAQQRAIAEEGERLLRFALDDPVSIDIRFGVTPNPSLR